MKENEIREKLKELVEEQPNPKVDAAPIQEEKNPALSEKRKRALLNYLALLFGAAFVVVAISLVFTWKSHAQTVALLNDSTTNAVSRAEALQQDNQALRTHIQELENALADNKAALEYSEAASQEYLESVKTEAALSTQRLHDGYELLLWARSALERGDRETFTEVMLRLEPLAEYLGDEGQDAYRQMQSFDWNADQPN